MKYYSYFPGCSSSDGGARAYGRSAVAVGKVLDVDFKELDDWNCCGSTPYNSFDELASLTLSGRNLALAEKRGFDLVTPCSSCYVMLNRTNSFMAKYPHVKSQVEAALAAGGLKYGGGVRVRHILDVFARDVGFKTIAGRVKKNLDGLKVAPYYGCQIVRPKNDFDHPENPLSLDRLIESLGGEAVPFPMKSRCCGASLIISEQDVAVGLIKKILDSAAAGGAQCLITVCPLCQTNLDAYQSQVNKRYHTDFKIPVLFFTQLMGVALGIAQEELGLKSGIVPAQPVLAKYL